jgi:hypothetical protein
VTRFSLKLRDGQRFGLIQVLPVQNSAGLHWCAVMMLLLNNALAFASPVGTIAAVAKAMQVSLLL